ncbi:MAG TPA: hypothetical protein PLD20_18745 [Blastocatellia bacterium]|nr:hypothetical protein [Blastocatellia bacterium]HMV85506.1 hypothetical protein [Blastocatellia bacterium]HMX29267.1 hypothetical protein [Blastocatellia bacterium]HMY70318.1 hypothetical protein [Blastocatellia bacterium]HMZ19983.1 hypothetical protein [Blastocatellia bacterium]
MSERKFHLLLSPLFTATLFLLLANDFVFKSLFHNWITGKLSDFSGLFTFFLFWIAFFPHRSKVVGGMIAVSFAFWKSAWSKPLIDWVNCFAPYRVGRVTDWGDLLALIVLPGAAFYAKRYVEPATSNPLWIKVRHSMFYIVCGLSVFAFTATQFVNDRRVSVYREYEFALEKSDLVSHLHLIGLQEVRHWRSSDDIARALKLSEEDRNNYDLVLSARLCQSSVTAHITLHDKKGKTMLKLHSIRFWCNQHTPQHNEEGLQIFERSVIEKLQAKQNLEISK